MSQVAFADKNEALWEIDELTRREKEKEKWTPDHLKLAQYSHQYMFVVDSLKKAQLQHWLIKEAATMKATAFTSDLYVSYDYGLGNQAYNIPIPHEEEKKPKPYLSYMNAPPSIIAGELFLISDYTVFEKVDRLKANGVKFIRKRVDIQIPYRREKWIKDVSKIPSELIPITPGRATTGWYTHNMKAWMYVGVKDYWEPLIDGGYLFKPTPLIKPNSEWVEHYYLFNNRHNE